MNKEKINEQNEVKKLSLKNDVVFKELFSNTTINGLTKVAPSKGLILSNFPETV